MDASEVLLLFLCVSQGGTIKITGSVTCFLPKLLTVKWHGKSLGIKTYWCSHLAKTVETIPRIRFYQTINPLLVFMVILVVYVSDSKYHLLTITKPRCLFSPWNKLKNFLGMESSSNPDLVNLQPCSNEPTSFFHSLLTKLTLIPSLLWHLTDIERK